jgi:hypothetical protein
MAFAFRIRFRVQADRGLTSHLPGLTFGVSGREYRLASRDAGEIGDSNWLVVTAHGFCCAEEARAAGLTTKAALRWCGLRLGMGIDPGQDGSLGGVTETGRRWLRELHGLDPATTIHNDVHGLQVYEDEDPRPRFVGQQAALKVTSEPHVFIGVLREACEAQLELTPKLSDALDLHAAARFLGAPEAMHTATSGRARFLTQWTALETLAPDSEFSASAKGFLSELLRSVQDASVADAEKAAILSSIRNMKPASIGRRCRDLVERYVAGRQYAGVPAAEFATKCYRARCGLTHGSRRASEFAPLLTPLETLVADVLEAAIEEHWERR